MDGSLLDLGGVTAWVLSDFWISLAFATALLVLRVWPRSRRPEANRFLIRHAESLRLRRSESATSVPFLVWAVDANYFTRIVESTHASVDAAMLLASKQVFLGALLALALIVGLDLLGRHLEARQSNRAVAELPTSVVLVLGTVLMDWLLSQLGWWALIQDHLSQLIASSTGL